MLATAGASAPPRLSWLFPNVVPGSYERRAAFRHVHQGVPPPILFCEARWMSLREAHRATKQSRADEPLSARDCFASLATTGWDHDPI
jgi:hypothetical protein